MSANLTIKIIHSLAEIPAAEWNQFNHDNQPFLSHEFLHGLEQFGCLGEHVGWYPHHLLAYDENQQLIAAMPCYEKHNSFGEFIFDWQWASAYEQAGYHYYPKLVSSVPFSPLTGDRILTSQTLQNSTDLYKTFYTFITQLTETGHYSSAHILFPTAQQKDAFMQTGFASRMGYQYHWHNQNYASFEQFLAGFSSKKRRNVKRERRLAADIEGVYIEQRYADSLDDAEWEAVYRCYQSTFHEKGNFPSLTLAFFKHLATHMGQQIIIFTAIKAQNIVAASICFKSNTTLYGRYWGCLEEFDCLHFELCFYQGIEYCIQHKLQCFEPGAQGEHKITRGFLPQQTWSVHWIQNAAFRTAISDFLAREKAYYQENVYADLSALSPFKANLD